MSGFAESTKFIRLAFLARMLWRLSDTIRNLCCLVWELPGSYLGDEVWRGEPGSDVLPMLVLLVVLRLSNWLVVSTTNDSNKDVEKLGKPHEQQIQLMPVSHCSELALRVYYEYWRVISRQKIREFTVISYDCDISATSVRVLLDISTRCVR